MSNEKQKGFTLVELMIVVAIIGVLAAVAVPKFADMLEKSREGATLGNLSAVNSAVSAYFADLRGIYPADLSKNTTIAGGVLYPAFLPDYLNDIPNVKVVGKNPANGPNAQGPGKNPYLAGNVTVGNFSSPAFTNNGAGVGWKYNNIDGTFWVNSSMVDMAGKTYTLYGLE